MLLAIDTATHFMSLALHDGKTLLAEQAWRCGNQHNLLLAPSIQQLLAVCDVTPQDLSAIAVTKGPGSYTGLRIGIALAKGMASSANLPLVGISTLDVLALSAPTSKATQLICAVQAGRGRILYAPYEQKKGAWHASAEPTISEWATLLPTLEEGTRITGEVDDKGMALLTERGVKVQLVDAPARLRRAGILAQEAWRQLTETDGADWLSHFDPAKLVPVYVNTASVAS